MRAEDFPPPLDADGRPDLGVDRLTEEEKGRLLEMLSDPVEGQKRMMAFASATAVALKARVQPNGPTTVSEFRTFVESRHPFVWCLVATEAQLLEEIEAFAKEREEQDA